MYSFLKAFLVLMKLLSLSQFYAPLQLIQQLCILKWVVQDGHVARHFDRGGKQQPSFNM